MHSVATPALDARTEAVRDAFPFLVEEDKKYDGVKMRSVVLSGVRVVAYKGVCAACGDGIDQLNVENVCPRCIKEGKLLEVRKKESQPENSRQLSVVKPQRMPRGEDVQIRTCSASEYIKEFGEPLKYRGKGVYPRTMKLWNSLLALKDGDYLIVECGKRNPGSLRSTLQNSMSRMVKLTNQSFKVKAAASEAHNHVAIWKVPLA